MASDANFYGLIAAIAARHGPRACWSEPGIGELSWANLHDATARHAAALRDAGVQPGDRVLAQVEKSAASLLLYFGCLRAGAAFVPLNTAYTDAELAYFIGDAEPRLIVCDPDRRASLEALHAAVRIETLDGKGEGSWSQRVAAARVDADAVTVVPRAAADLAAIVYTSGTTGRSKGAMISHGNLAANGLALRDAWHIRADDVLLHALPTYHVHGLFIALHSTMLAGARVILLPRFDVEAVLRALPSATLFMGVPTHYTRLLAEPRFTREQTAHVRTFFCGSAPLLPSTFAEFERRTGQRILERYGMSEAGVIASNPHDGERLPGTVGFAIAGTQARVATADGAVAPDGETGVLEIRGDSVFQGYWRRPELARSEFRDGWFVTGDLATRDGDGRIAIVGRARDLIISGGFNVYPKEIELEIDALPGVVESAVIGVPHADFGEAVVAVVTLARGAALTEQQVIAALAQRLARFKLPKRVLFVDDLPRNAMAKVQKVVLRAQHRDLFAAATRRSS